MGIIPSIQVNPTKLSTHTRCFHILTVSQPTHATSDMAYALSRLGYGRLSHSAYRMSSLFPPSSSSPSESAYPGPVLGSDFPVEPPNPFHGMYAAVTRLNPATGTSPSGKGGWYPRESLSVEQALLGFTRNGAYGWFQEDNTGAIEVGKWADWVVIDWDILADRSGRSLRDVVVKETWMGGRRVFPLELMMSRTEDWKGKVAEACRDPLTEMIVAVTKFVDALARLIEALTALLKAVTDSCEEKYKVFMGK